MSSVERVKETFRSNALYQSGTMTSESFLNIVKVLNPSLKESHWDFLVDAARVRQGAFINCDGFMDFLFVDESAQLAKLLAEASALELRCWAGEDVSAQLEQVRSEIQWLHSQGVKPSPGHCAFQQIDVGEKGAVERVELLRMLKALPRIQNGEIAMVEKKFLNSDGNGLIDVEEWLTNLRKLPELCVAIESVLDLETGRVKTYRSVCEQLAKLLAEKSSLEVQCWAGEDVKKQLEETILAIHQLRNKGVKPSAGQLVFQQIDCDGDGNIDSGELERMLKALPKANPAPGVKIKSFDEMFEVFDSNGDGLIDEEEWLTNLRKLPGLRLAVESVLDPDTGRIKAYRSLSQQLARLLGDRRSLELRRDTGEDVSNELKKLHETIEKMRTQCLGPDPSTILFRHIDVNGNGSVAREELLRLLHSLPKAKAGAPVRVFSPSTEFVSIDQMIAHFDSTENSVIDEEEFLATLGKLPGLRMAIENAVDVETGGIMAP